MTKIVFNKELIGKQFTIRDTLPDKVYTVIGYNKKEKCILFIACDLINRIHVKYINIIK